RGAEARARAGPPAAFPAPGGDDAAAARSREKLTLEERFPRPSLMGVVNVTPDSFSDGGVHYDADVAATAARRMVEEGAAIVDVASEVASFLEERMAFAIAQGISEERICLDPGIGFGKTVEHNFELVRRLDVLLALGRPLLIGFSRKSSLGRVVGDPDAQTGPLSASVAAAVASYERGATILRVHDVREHVEALAVARAVAGTA